VSADINQFAESETTNRLVLTLGKFAIVDIIRPTIPKAFLSWSLINAGTFDCAGDAWATATSCRCDSEGPAAVTCDDGIVPGGLFKL
jgi:hypothetical protein